MVFRKVVCSSFFLFSVLVGLGSDGIRGLSATSTDIITFFGKPSGRACDGRLIVVFMSKYWFS